MRAIRVPFSLSGLRITMEAPGAGFLRERYAKAIAIPPEDRAHDVAGEEPAAGRAGGAPTC